MNSGKLGALLVSKGLITQEQLNAAAQFQSQEKTRLGSSLVQLGHVNENVLISFFCSAFGLQAIFLEGLQVSPEVLRLVPEPLY